MRKDWCNQKRIYCFLYIIIVLITMLPLAGGYIMQGGTIDEWVTRIQETTLFPKIETILSTGNRMNAFHSNLWFLPSAILFAVIGKLEWSYLLQMIVIQIGSLFASYLMFHEIFPEEEEKMAVLFGVLFYMTCPYRIYCCYDKEDLFQATAWMIFPFYVWAAGKVIKEKKWQYILTAAIALAGIGYADSIYFFIAFGISVLIAIIFRNWRVMLTLLGGIILFFPGLWYLMGYLFTERYAEISLPLSSIMDNGYTIGEYFNFYIYQNGKPGLGFGIFFGLFAGLWMTFVFEKKEKSKEISKKIPVEIPIEGKFFFWLAVLMFCCSLKYFPWDYIQRLGIWSLKFVGLIGTPAIFGGIAQFFLCVPAAWASCKISRSESKYISVGMMFLIFFSALGLCIYHCYILIYERVPFE